MSHDKTMEAMQLNSNSGKNLTIRYDPSLVRRAAIVSAVAGSLLLFASVINYPDRVLGSSFLGESVPPFMAVVAFVNLVVSLISMKEPRVSVHISDNGLAIFKPPRMVRLEWGDIRSAEFAPPNLIGPYGLKVHSADGSYRVRFLSADSRTLLVAVLRQRGVIVLE